MNPRFRKGEAGELKSACLTSWVDGFGTRVSVALSETASHAISFPPLAKGGNSVRLDFCYGQRFMAVELRAGCQYWQRTAKLTVWLEGGLRRDWSWDSHVEAQNDHNAAQHKTPQPVQQSTGRCLGEHGN